jgi:hypothetical protein
MTRLTKKYIKDIKKLHTIGISEDAEPAPDLSFFFKINEVPKDGSAYLSKIGKELVLIKYIEDNAFIFDKSNAWQQYSSFLVKGNISEDSVYRAKNLDRSSYSKDLSLKEMFNNRGQYGFKFDFNNYNDPRDL